MIFSDMEIDQLAQASTLKELGVPIHRAGPGPLNYAPLSGVLEVKSHEVRGNSAGVDPVTEHGNEALNAFHRRRSR